MCGLGRMTRQATGKTFKHNPNIVPCEPGMGALAEDNSRLSPHERKPARRVVKFDTYTAYCMPT